MNAETFLIIAIDSTQLVMKLEKLLLSSGVEVRVIPLPGEIKASCGLSIRAEIADAKRILEIFQNDSIDESLYSFYECKKIGFKKEISSFNF